MLLYLLQSVLFWFFICLRNDFRVSDFCPEMKTLISIIIILVAVGCTDEKELRMLSNSHNNLLNEHEESKSEIIDILDSSKP